MHARIQYTDVTYCRDARQGWKEAVVIALDRSSPYTPKPQRKRITRWSRAGKKMLMEFLFL
jgi:hypothetical protein